ncbi:tetratricopeptide repeat protein [Anianabacter salinae]|uniref:tetratricopeptide repeat protein n=1 Tax=Anianabacter salinae TaxID=2851023 RepID=UPI003899007A
MIVPLVMLVACGTPDGPALDAGQGPYAPVGIDPDGETVDGLIVGHRLMEAQEYELALDAYIRGAAEQGLTPDTLSAMGSANLKLGRLDQAENLLRQAVEKDETFVPAWNNLGVVLMEQGKTGEAMATFRQAFALDSGGNAGIRENLSLALAKLDNPEYSEQNKSDFALVRRGKGDYRLLTGQ